MRADKIYIEGRTEYPILRIVPASPGERDPGDGAISQRDGSFLPVPYRRKEIKSSAAYIVNLSSRELQASEKEYPVLQAVFDLADRDNEIGYRVHSWKRTVAGILGWEIRKGLRINLVV